MRVSFGTCMIAGFLFLPSYGFQRLESTGRKVTNKLVATDQRAMTPPGRILNEFKPSAKERDIRRISKKGWKRKLQLKHGQSIPVVLNCYKTRGGTTYIRGHLDGDDLSLLAIIISGETLRGIISTPSLGNCTIHSDAAGIQIEFQLGESWLCGTGD